MINVIFLFFFLPSRIKTKTFLLHVSHKSDVTFRAAGEPPRGDAQGAEADVEGLTHLKALERQPQDERWPLGGEKKGGAGA